MICPDDDSSGKTDGSSVLGEGFSGPFPGLSIPLPLPLPPVPANRSLHPRSSSLVSLSLACGALAPAVPTATRTSLTGNDRQRFRISRCIGRIVPGRMGHLARKQVDLRYL